MGDEIGFWTAADPVDAKAVHPILEDGPVIDDIAAVIGTVEQGGNPFRFLVLDSEQGIFTFRHDAGPPYDVLMII
ncbi:MAG: hypothetical protein HFF18_03885 [Oscillospiraceae bacterium]|nr:hypothetical protein [Oscillospiraceae bacterium]